MLITCRGRSISNGAVKNPDLTQHQREPNDCLKILKHWKETIIYLAKEIHFHKTF